MTYAVFVAGFMLAVLVILLMAAFWLLAKGRLQSWGYDLTRETHTLLRDTNLKLDTIKFQQERVLSGLERLEHSASTRTTTQTDILDDLRSRLAKLETAV